MVPLRTMTAPAPRSVREPSSSSRTLRSSLHLLSVCRAIAAPPRHDSLLLCSPTLRESHVLNTFRNRSGGMLKRAGKSRAEIPGKSRVFCPAPRLDMWRNAKISQKVLSPLFAKADFSRVRAGLSPLNAYLKTFAMNQVVLVLSNHHE